MNLNKSDNTLGGVSESSLATASTDRQNQTDSKSKSLTHRGRVRPSSWDDSDEELPSKPNTSVVTLEEDQNFSDEAKDRITNTETEEEAEFFVVNRRKTLARMRRRSKSLSPDAKPKNEACGSSEEPRVEATDELGPTFYEPEALSSEKELDLNSKSFLDHFFAHYRKTIPKREITERDQIRDDDSFQTSKLQAENLWESDFLSYEDDPPIKTWTKLPQILEMEETKKDSMGSKDPEEGVNAEKTKEKLFETSPVFLKSSDLDVPPSVLYDLKHFEKSENGETVLFCQLPQTPKPMGSLSPGELSELREYKGSTSEGSDDLRGRKTNKNVIFWPAEKTQMNLRQMEEQPCDSLVSKENSAKLMEELDLGDSLMIDLTKCNTDSYRSENGKTEENTDEESQSSASGNVNLEEVKTRETGSWRGKRKSWQSLASKKSGPSSCGSEKTLEYVGKSYWTLKTENYNSQSETSSLCEQHDITSSRSALTERSISEVPKPEQSTEKFVHKDSSKNKVTKNFPPSDRSLGSKSRDADKRLEIEVAFHKYSVSKVEPERSARSETIEIVKPDKKNHSNRSRKSEPPTPFTKFRKSSGKSTFESEIRNASDSLETSEIGIAKQSRESERSSEHSFRSTGTAERRSILSVDADSLRQATSLQLSENAEDKGVSSLDKTDAKVPEESTSKRSTRRESKEDTQQWKSIERMEKTAEHEKSRTHRSDGPPSKSIGWGKSVQQQAISNEQSDFPTEMAVTDYSKNKEDKRSCETMEQSIHKTSDKFEGSNPSSERESLRKVKRKSNKSTKRSEEKTESSKVKTPKTPKPDSSTARSEIPEEQPQQENMVSNKNLTMLQKFNLPKVKQKAETERRPKRISSERERGSLKIERPHSHRPGGSTRPEGGEQDSVSGIVVKVTVQKKQTNKSGGRIEEPENGERDLPTTDSLERPTPASELLEKKPDEDSIDQNSFRQADETQIRERKLNRLSKRSKKSSDRSILETPKTDRSTARIEIKGKVNLYDVSMKQKNVSVQITQKENTEREERERKSNRISGKTESLSGSPKPLKSNGGLTSRGSTSKDKLQAEDVSSDFYIKSLDYPEEGKEETERRSSTAGGRSEKTTERSRCQTPVTYRSEGSARQEVYKAKLPLGSVSSRSSLSLGSNEFTEETNSYSKKIQPFDNANQERSQNTSEMQIARSGRKSEDAKSSVRRDKSSEDEQKTKRDTSSPPKTVESSYREETVLKTQSSKVKPEGVASRSRTFNVEGYKYIQLKWNEQEEEVKSESVLEENVGTMFRKIREKSMLDNAMWKHLIQEFDGEEEIQEYFWVRAVDKPVPSKEEEPKGKLTRRSSKEKQEDDKPQKAPRNVPDEESGRSLVGSNDSRSCSDKEDEKDAAGTPVPPLTPWSNAPDDDEEVPVRKNVQKIFYVTEERDNFNRIGDFGDGPSWKIDDFGVGKLEKPRDHGDGDQIPVSAIPNKMKSGDDKRQVWEEVTDRVAKWKPLRYTWAQQEDDTWDAVDPLRRSKSDEWMHRKSEDAETQSETTMRDEPVVVKSPPGSQKKRKRGPNSPMRVGSSTESIRWADEDVESLPSLAQRLSRSLSNLDLDRVELSGSVYNSRSELFERNAKESDDEKESTNLNLFLARKKKKDKAEVAENNWLVVAKPDDRKWRKGWSSKSSSRRLGKMSCFQNFYRRVIRVLCLDLTSSSAATSK